MPSIRAWQHIYANVERDRSPTNRAGFQTLFYSEELSDQDVADIEERVFYVAGNYNPVKRVFFQLSSGKVGIGQVKPIEGRDTAGREGLYMAHTLIFESEVFQSHHLNPLLLFDADIFIDTLDAAFAQGDKNTGNLKTIEIEIPPPSQPENRWPTETFRQLVQLAINHPALASDRAALALLGSAPDIHTTLRFVLSFLPASMLPACAFDTFFERGGNLSFTYCWAAGFQNRPRQPIFILVDVDNKRIESATNFSVPATSFGRWMDHMLEIGQTEYAIANKEVALQAGNYLDRIEGQAKDIFSLDEQVLDSVFDVNQDTLTNAIRKRVANALPSLLTKRIFESFFSSLTTQDRITAIEQGFTAERLTGPLFSAYQQLGFTSPAKEERQALSELLETTSHQELEWLLLIWGGGSWSNPIIKWRIQGGLEKMNEETYESFWQFAIPSQLVDPMHMLIEERAPTFTKLIIQHQLLPLDEVPALVKTLVKSENADSLQLLAPFLNQLDKKQLKKIKRRIRDVENVSPIFAQTLDLLEV